MCSFGISIVTGIISGVISSVFIYYFLFCIKPKVDIAAKVAANIENNGQALIRIKVVNKTHTNLAEVKYTLHKCHRYSDGIVHIDQVKSLKEPIPFIPRYSNDDQNASYAVRYTFALDPNILTSDDDYLLFSFYAKHSVSGSAIFIQREYRSGDIWRGAYQTRESTDILVDKSACKVSV